MNILIAEQSKINKKYKTFKYRKNNFKIKIYTNMYLFKNCILSEIEDQFDDNNTWSIPVDISYTDYFKIKE